MRKYRQNIVTVLCYTTLLAAPLLAIVAERRSSTLLHLLVDKFEFRPRHCADILLAGHSMSGVYTVFHNAAGAWGQRVYCDMDTDGGGWTVFQRRGQYGNNVYYFYRNWIEYAEGFGDPDKEYWIGNRALHILTSGEKTMSLRVVLSNNTEDTLSVDYESISVGNEESLFEIQIGEYLGPEGWDSMSDCNGVSFSTFDNDNDSADSNCALIYRGAWWYKECSYANLNGLNLNGPHASESDGIEWELMGVPNPSYHYSYPSVRMMIRPAGFTLRP